MKLKIVGSGGMYPIPSPFCKCKICDEAREKRGLFERVFHVNMMIYCL